MEREKRRTFFMFFGDCSLGWLRIASPAAGNPDTGEPRKLLTQGIGYMISLVMLAPLACILHLCVAIPYL